MGSETLRFNEKTMRVLQRSAMFSGFALENIDKVIIEAEAYELTFQEGEFIRRQALALCPNPTRLNHVRSVSRWIVNRI